MSNTSDTFLLEGAADAQLPAAYMDSRCEAPRAREVLLWHWGQAGAGAKYTFELVNQLRRLPGIRATVSAVKGSELDLLTTPLDGIGRRTVSTFRGDKRSLFGKLAALGGLLKLPKLALDFRSTLRDLPADVVICTMQSIWDAAAISVLRCQASRFILVLHDAQFHPGDAYPGREAVSRGEIAAADALIVLSDHVGRSAEEIYGFPADRIWTVPHGSFSFGEEEATPRSFPKERPIRLLFIGRISAYKGLGLLLDTYRALRQQGVPVELEIVGSGDMAPYRDGLAGLPDVTVINRWVDECDIDAALKRADIVVLPYIEASQSGVAASALTAGLPIVATPVGGLGEQVRHGQSGVIADSVTAPALGAAIRTLVDDPAFYEKCSAGALDFVRRELGWAGIAEKVAHVVEAVASRPRRRAE